MICVQYILRQQHVTHRSDATHTGISICARPAYTIYVECVVLGADASPTSIVTYYSTLMTRETCMIASNVSEDISTQY